MTTQRLLEQAVRKHRQGAMDAARDLYLQIIDADPQHPDARHLLGVLFHQVGKPASAIGNISKAIEMAPSRADFHHNLANAFRAQGLNQKAVESYRKAITLKPDYTDAYLALGTLLEKQGEYDEAMAEYLSALRINPNCARIWNQQGNLYLQQKAYQEAIRHYRTAVRHDPNLSYAYNGMGVAFKECGDYRKAIAAYRRAIELAPDYAQAHFNLGYAHTQTGQYAKALYHYKKALSIEPFWPDARHNLGNVYFQLDRFQEAVSCYLSALKGNADLVEAYNNLGCAYRELGRIEEALDCFDRALALKPDFAMALKNAGLLLYDQGKNHEAENCFQKLLVQQPKFEVEVLVAMLHPIIFESCEAIAEHRQSFRNKLLHLANKGRQLEDPVEQVGLTNFLLGMHGYKEKEIREQIARFYLQVCPQLAWKSPHLNKSRGATRIRIGFVSKFLCEHTIGRLYHGLIENLSADKFHVSVFHIGRHKDSISKKINQCADEVVYLPKDLKAARELIAEKRLDILFFPEVGMDPLTYFLAFSRLAPVQCKRGFQITMGIPSIDYFISTKWAEPESAQEHYSEKLILLNRTGYYYLRPDMPVDIPARSQVGLPERTRIYACLQSPIKIHPDFDAVICRILQKDPNGVLVLMQGKHHHRRSLLMRRFEKRIPDVVERIYFLPGMPRHKFMTLFLLADAVLDTIHISGGNTSLECFAWGVPVVTWPGPYLPGRLTYGFYKQMGILDCVADDLRQYVDLAVRLANDKAWYTAIKNKIENRSHLIFEDRMAVQELEAFFQWAVAMAYGGGKDTMFRETGDLT